MTERIPPMRFFFAALRRNLVLMRRIETLILILALGFYVWFLRRFGFGGVLACVRLVGWGLALTIALEAVSRISNTFGWRAVIPKLPPNLGFGEMFMARIAGEATDYVTPSAQLGGQFVMALDGPAQAADGAGTRQRSRRRTGRRASAKSFLSRPPS